MKSWILCGLSEKKKKKILCGLSEGGIPEKRSTKETKLKTISPELVLQWKSLSRRDWRFYLIGESMNDSVVSKFFLKSRISLISN